MDTEAVRALMCEGSELLAQLPNDIADSVIDKMPAALLTFLAAAPSDVAGEIQSDSAAESRDPTVLLALETEVTTMPRCHRCTL